MDLQRMISAERNEELVGRRIQALIDEVVDDPGPLGEAAQGRPVGVARTVGQAIEVDGVTHLYPDAGLAPGEFVTVEIVDTLEYDLIGRALPS